MTLAHDKVLSDRLIGLAIGVHRILGPGLLESAYEKCLVWELEQNGIRHARQVPLPVNYKGVHLDCGDRPDIIVNNQIIIELKSVDRLLPIHAAQILTYLRLSGLKVGLIFNFNTLISRDGIKRFVM